MTIAEVFGCSMIAFGPPLIMYIVTISKDPLLIIVCFASAFFWMISLLLSAALWMIVIPLRDLYAFGLVFSVLFQETFRLLFYILIRKAERGLEKVWQMGVNDKSLFTHSNRLSYVAGLGFGTISGVFSLVNLLAAMNGPGTIGLRGDDQDFFINSAFMALGITLNHIFWGLLFFDGIKNEKYYQPVCVVCCHMIVSCFSLLALRGLVCISLTVTYAMLVGIMIWYYFASGGSIRSFVGSFTKRPSSEQVQQGSQ